MLLAPLEMLSITPDLSEKLNEISNLNCFSDSVGDETLKVISLEPEKGT